MSSGAGGVEAFANDVRLHIYREAAATGRVPQAPEISAALGRPETDVRATLQHLAAGKAVILTPLDAAIWIAPPFCAVPSSFRVVSGGTRFWGICIWDAMGIAAALDADSVITALCGDCGIPMTLEIRNGRLLRSEGVVHFGVPARRWWDNIGFT